MALGFMIVFDGCRSQRSKETLYLAGALLGLDHIAKSDVTREFLQILKHTRHLKCTDPRDKIYGLLELCDFTSAPFLRVTPDYSKSVGDVYTDVATRAIKTTGNLSILLTAGIKRPTNPDLVLPSWVPNFHTCWSWDDRYEFYGFSASGNRVGKINFLQSSQDVENILEADGVIVDTIASKFIWAPAEEYQAHATKLLLRLDELGSISSRPRQLSYIHALFRTLIFDEPGLHYGKREIADRGDCKDLLLCALGFAHGLETTGVGGSDKFLDSFDWLDWPGESEHQLSRMGETTLNQCRVRYLNQSRNTRESIVGQCFLTAGDTLVWGPPLVTTTDSLCVLLGCPVPLIIRREDDHFLLVGSCYVYGMMMGEVMEDLAQPDIDLNVETLRLV